MKAGIALLAALVLIGCLIGYDASCDDVPQPLHDSELDDYLITKNREYSSITPDSTVETLTEDEIKNNGYSMEAPDGYRFEYVKHSNQGANYDLLTMGVMDSVWYPGALVKLTSSSGTTVPIPFTESRSPYVISLNLESGGESGLSATVHNPSLSEAREAVSSIVGNYLNSGKEIPISYTCTVSDASVIDSLCSSLGTTVDMFGLNLGLKTDFSTSTEVNRIAIVFKQTLFEISMDPPVSPSSIFSDDVSSDKVRIKLSDGEALAYVNVSYGKVVVVCLETTKSVSEIKGSFDASYSSIIDLESSLKQLNSSSETKISYLVYGGSSESLGLMKARNTAEIVSILAEDDSYTAKPISYSFHFLDGTIAKFYNFNEYVTRELVIDTTDHYKDLFDGGDGTPNNPFLVSNREQLESIADKLDANFIIISDIDLSDKSWIPLGDSNEGPYARFSGTLDGDGHTISGMRIDSITHVHSGGSHSGLFAIIDGGTVKNLKLTDVEMSPIRVDGGEFKVGSVAGTIIGGLISKVYAQGRMTCSEGALSNTSAGGIVGAVNKFGTPHKVTISGCVTDIDIRIYGNNAYAGGIIGHINGSMVTVDHCFSYGDVRSRGYGGAFDYRQAASGGIAGKVETGCEIYYVYSTGRIDSDVNWTYKDSGGIIGCVNSEEVYVSNAFYIKGNLYEGNNRQPDVFCDGNRNIVNVTNVECLVGMPTSTSYFESWDLYRYGLDFSEGRVLPLT